VSPIILGVLTCFFLSSSGVAASLDLAKVTRYELRVRIQPAEEHLTASARITLSNPTAAPQREIPFLLYRLLAVDAAEDEKGAALAFHQAVVSMSDEKNWQVNSVTLTLREPLPPGGTTRITLKYSGAIFGYREVMGYVRDHIGEDYTLLRPDALAYPMLAGPSFPSLSAAYDTLFAYDLEITVPSGTIVASGGLPGGVSVGEGTQTFRFANRVPTWRMDIAATKFKVLKNDAGNLVVYAFPEDEAGAGNLLKEMQRVMEFYTLRFGPSKKATAYTIIEIPDGWGSQASDFYILQAAAAFKDPKRAHELYHEIGHSWNVKAIPEVRRTRWFDEAFASYFEALALREFEGQKAFNDRMAMYREHFRNEAKKNSRSATTPITEYGKEELGGNSYTKGPWSLYVLHQIVGDEGFNQIIRTFLADFSDRPAGFGDFQGVAERVSKRELSRFFREWIFGSESSELLMGNASLQEIVERYR
jgi:Peptidase family M1 domain